MRISFPLIWLLFLCLLPAGAYAQADSMATQSDSVNNKLLQTYSARLQEIETQRMADSVKKVSLQQQLDSLKKTDNIAKTTTLQAELDALKQKEQQQLLQKKLQIDSLRLTARGYPVMGFFNDTLFIIYSKLGSFSASERAAAVSARIRQLKNKLYFRTDSLTIVDMESSIDILSGETIIASVTQNDAIWNNTTKEELAGHYRNIIGAAVMKYRAETNVATLAKEIGLAVLVLLIIGFIIRYTGKFFKWTARKIKEQENKRIHGIKIKNYVLFDAAREIKVLLNVNAVLKWLFILLIIYITLPILFGIFPWTQNFADTLFGYILTPVKKMLLSFWHFLPNLITIIVIIVVFRYILKGIHFLKNEVQMGNLKINGFYPDWANPTYQIVRVLILAFMVVIIFPYLPGSDSPIFKGVSVFLGFLFTFGSAGSLSNVIAGLVLTYMRLFKIGDRVKIADVTGDVIEKSLLVTRIRTIKNEIISIPNSTVMNSHTINYSSDAPDKGLIIHSTVTIGYDVPWQKMEDALVTAALRTELVMQDPKPFVLQTGLEDFYVSYQINAYTKHPNKQAAIYSQLHQHIQDVCNEAGIEIMSPHYRAARDGSNTTIPPSYLPEDYVAPGFNVNVKKGE